MRALPESCVERELSEAISAMRCALDRSALACRGNTLLEAGSRVGRRLMDLTTGRSLSPHVALMAHRGRAVRRVDPAVGHRSEPHTQVAEMRRIASVGSMKDDLNGMTGFAAVAAR
jgi:hypothetical protein